MIALATLLVLLIHAPLLAFVVSDLARENARKT